MNQKHCQKEDRVWVAELITVICRRGEGERRGREGAKLYELEEMLIEVVDQEKKEVRQYE